MLVGIMPCGCFMFCGGTCFKNAAQALAEAGCSDREIMAITGHRTTQMVSLYTKRVEQRRMARSAMDKLEAQPGVMNFGQK